MTLPFIIGISGASGAIYGIRLLEVLKAAAIPTHLVISKAAQLTIASETPYALRQVQALATEFHPIQEISASIASGSFKTQGMIIAPCSMKMLGEIANGCGGSLIARAADVTLKERRRLVLMARETPLTLAHLRNMTAVTEMGGIIAPPMPAFYSNPQNLEEMVDHTVGRVLDLFSIDHPLVKRWEGLPTV